MASTRGLMVPRTSSTLSSPEANHVPYQKLPALPLLLLTLPSRLGSWSILSIFPMTASRGRRLHPRLVPPCINCSPSYPWCSDLYSARRIAQAKVQVHKWTVAKRRYKHRQAARRMAMAKAAGKDPQPPSPEINDPGRSRPVASASHTSVTQAPTSIWPEPEPEPEPRLGELPPQPLVGERYVGDFITTRHIVWFSLVLGAALVISAVWLHATADIGFRKGILEMSVKLLKTSGFRQTLALLGAIMFVRLGLEPAVRLVRNILGVKGAWLQSSEYYLLKEVYRPIEGLLVVAACCTLVENFAPSIIAIPKKTVHTVVYAILSLSFVMATAGVVFNVKARMVKETIWEMELSGKVTQQRRVEAVDKLLTLVTVMVTGILGMQAVGLDVNSLLAIGGIGGLAAGLAGREVLENLFNGLIIMTSSPFEVGEEVIFQPPNGREVEGIVVDVGWYRTSIRSFEREVFVIPNSVFSKAVVLNVTRKNGEWRFYEFLHLRPEDISVVSAIVTDMRKVIRSHPSVIQKLHRRVFLNKVTKEEVELYVSFYCSAINRDAFMAIRQDLFMTFLDILKQHGAEIAKKSLKLYLDEIPDDTIVKNLPPRTWGGAEVDLDAGDTSARLSSRTLRGPLAAEASDRHSYEAPEPPRNNTAAKGRKDGGKPTPCPTNDKISGPELAESIIYGAVVVGGVKTGSAATGANGPVTSSDDGETLDMILGEWTDDQEIARKR